MAKGFIKLHRNIQDHWLWDEPFSKAQAWIDLLLMVNHAPARFKHGSHFVELDRGQTVTSAYKLAARWRWGEKKARTFLGQLESEGMIRKEATRHYTVLTIENYSKWQGETDEKEDARRTHARTENGRTETVDNADAEEKQDARRTHARTENGLQTRSKEVKKNKEVKNKEKRREPEAEAEKIPYQRVIELFHSACPSFPKIVKLTDARKKTIAARWKEYGQGMKPFFQLFNAAEASDFLKGSNTRNWQATFDWLLKADNMAKALEGNYSNQKGGNGDANHGKRDGKRDQYESLGIDLDELEM